MQRLAEVGDIYFWNELWYEIPFMNYEEQWVELDLHRLTYDGKINWSGSKSWTFDALRSIGMEVE